MASNEIKSWQSKILMRVVHVYFAATRGMTMGVRAACFDRSGRVFLVRHSYVPGWHMPGGGIERRETSHDALVKELREEGNLTIVGEPQLFQVYLNTSASRRDHVVFYRADVEQTAPRKPDAEIVECGFFALDALPEGTTEATRRRLRELSGEEAAAHYW